MNDQLQDAERVAKGAEPRYTREQYEAVMFSKAEAATDDSGEGVANAFARLCGEGEFDALYAAGQAADIAEERAVIAKADPNDRFTPMLMSMAKMNRREGETLEACASRLLVKDEVVAAAYAATQGLQAMSRNLLSKLGPESHRVIAAAFIHERAFGKPMAASAIRRLSQAEGASYTACLAVILGKGINKESKPIRLGTPGSVINVPDEETEAALDWREKIDTS